MWRWLLALVLLAGIALGVVFGALNPDPVSIDLLAGRWTATLGTVVTLAFAAGVICGAVAMILLRLLPRSRKRVPKTASGSRSAQDSLTSDA